jgi:hypothetical protein
MKMGEEKQRVYFRPADRSLQAYKDWVMAETRFFTHGRTGNNENELTPEEWKAAWRKYWDLPEKKNTRTAA